MATKQIKKTSLLANSSLAIARHWHGIYKQTAEEHALYRE